MMNLLTSCSYSECRIFKITASITVSNGKASRRRVYNGVAAAILDASLPMRLQMFVTSFQSGSISELFITSQSIFRLVD